MLRNLTISLLQEYATCYERPEALGWDTDRVTVKQGFCCQKEIGINQTNENTLSHFDTNVQLYFWGKKFLYLPYQLYLFDFSLKGYIQFAPLKGLGGANRGLCITVSFAPFLYLLLKIHSFF